MNMQDMITLRSVAIEVDAYGVPQETTSDTEVYARVESVSASEFFEGGRNGLNPEYRMTMFSGDYSGETMLIYNGSTYAIYRTYQRRGDYIELYVERKCGTNGQKVQPGGTGDSGQTDT